MARPKTVHAALAVIKRQRRYLICQRRADTFLGGYWEFPGGKREPGESWETCLRRELKEELGIAITAVKPLDRLHYRYKTRAITFKVFRCRIAHGTPRALDAQGLRWVTPAQLHRYRFPPANQPLITRLLMSSHSAVTFAGPAAAPPHSSSSRRTIAVVGSGRVGPWLRVTREHHRT